MLLSHHNATRSKSRQISVANRHGVMSESTTKTLTCRLLADRLQVADAISAVSQVRDRQLLKMRVTCYSCQDLHAGSAESCMPHLHRHNPYSDINS